MLLTVAAASSATNSRPGTYISTKRPEITTPRYTQPVSRAVFFVDSITSLFVTVVSRARSAPSRLRERLPESLRRAGRDRIPVAEHGDVEVERHQLAQRALAQGEILVAEAVTEPHHVRARIGCKQHAAAGPQKRELSRAVAGHMNRLQAAADRQLGPLVYLAIDNARLDLAAAEGDERGEEDLAHEPRRRLHRPLAFAPPDHRRIVTVHIRDGARHPFQRGEAAGMIRMAVRDDDVFDVGDFLADR